MPFRKREKTKMMISHIVIQVLHTCFEDFSMKIKLWTSDETMFQLQYNLTSAFRRKEYYQI